MKLRIIFPDCSSKVKTISSIAFHILTSERMKPEYLRQEAEFMDVKFHLGFWA
jgi:hypothetical protein